MALDLTDARIKELLSVKKKIVRAEDSTYPTSIGQDFVLLGDDGETYKAYSRQSRSLPDSFSCGLRWCPKGGQEVTLARVNGSDHVHPNKLERTKIDQKCHVHKATERYIQAGLKTEGYAEESTDYTNLDGAIEALGRLGNIEGEPFTPPQKRLFS